MPYTLNAAHTDTLGGLPTSAFQRFAGTLQAPKATKGILITSGLPCSGLAYSAVSNRPAVTGWPSLVMPWGLKRISRNTPI